MKYSIICLVALSLFVSANGLGIPQFPATTDYWTNYPASFPWENEASVPEWPGGELNELDVFNEDTLMEIGGYNAKSSAYCNMFAFTPYGPPAGQGFCGTFIFFMVFVNFGMEPSYLSPFNCTAGTYLYEGADIKGHLGTGPQVCEVGACCPKYLGHFQPAQDYLSLQERWYGRYDKYYCDWYTEDVMCELVFYQFQWCLHQFTSGGAEDRLVVQACYDAHVGFFERCKTFKQAGPSSILISTPIEPEAYVMSLSPAQMNSVLGMFWNQDRICLPASAYNPEAAKAADAPAAEPAADGEPAAPAPATPASSTPAASSSDDSASAIHSAPVMLFAAMASFFTFSRLF